MANVLGLRAPHTAPVALRDEMLAYFAAAYPDIDAHLFAADLDAWATMREQCRTLPIAEPSVGVLTRYAAQLAFLLRLLDTKASSHDAAHTPFHVAFPWASGVAETPLHAYTSLAVERACIVQSLAAQYAELGAYEPRSEHASIKRATAFFQQAAGVLRTLERFACVPTVQDARPPVELMPEALHALRTLMLAQAQECFWQKAVQDPLKDTTIAKLARSAADLYAESARAASASALPPRFATHAQFKHHHFLAAAQFRKSRDDLAQRRYGDELGRLACAAEHVRRALALPTRLLPLPALLGDLRGLERMVQMNLTRAERDNQLIYLAAPTSAAQLPDLGTACMAHEAPPHALVDPHTVLSEGELWCARLMTYGIDVAERVYSDRKRQFVADAIEPTLAALDEAAAQTRAALHLPDLLNELETAHLTPKHGAAPTHALQRTPPAVLQRRVDGVHVRAGHCAEELARIEAALERTDPGASKAHVARQHTLQSHARAYRQTLDEARASDARVTAQWDAVRPALEALHASGAVHAGDAACAEALVPHRAALAHACKQAAPQLRAVRATLETLDDDAAQRRAFLLQLRTTCDADGLRTRLLEAARARHLGVHVDAEAVHPAALHDVLEAALDAYAPYRARCDALAHAQRARLATLRAQTEALLRDPTLAAARSAQDAALAKMKATWDAYETTMRHLDEGTAFYERLAALLHTLAEAVYAWSTEPEESTSSLAP